MVEENKKDEKNEKGCITAFLVIFILIMIPLLIGLFSNSKSIKDFSDYEIIQFSEKEVSKKLRYPETAVFQNKEIMKKDNENAIVSIYSVSDDKNHEEGRMHFIIYIKVDNDRLKLIDMATNNDTCNTDCAEEFEKLVNEKKYSELYNNLFSTSLKQKLSLDDFKSYNLNLTNSNTNAKPEVDSNNYIKYINVTIKDSNNQYWIMMIKNGMVYNFSKVNI